VETEELVKDQDARIIGRLLQFLRPYRLQFLLALLALILSSLGELYTPVLLQRAVDRFILADAAALTLPSGELADPVRELTDRLLNRARRSSGGGSLWEAGNQIFFSSQALGELTLREQELLEEAGVLDPKRWYLFERPAGKTAAEMGLAGEGLRLVLGSGFGAIGTEDLPGLPEEVIREIRRRDFAGIRKMGLLYLLILAEIMLFSFFQVYVMTRISQGVMRDLRMALLNRSFDQSLAFFNSRPLGGLVSRLTGDVETVNELLTSMATSLFRDVFVMAGVIVILFSMNVRLALITLGTLPPVIILTFLFRWQSRKAYRRLRMWISRVNGFLSERIMGMEIVQSFGREKQSLKEFTEKNKNLLKANLGEMYVFATFRPLIDFLSSVSIGIILYFGASYFFQARLTLGVLIAFVNLVGQFYRPMMDIAEKFNILQSAMAGSERIFDLLDTNEEIPDTGTEEAESITGEVEFRNVNFAYNPGEPVIRDMSFKIAPGESVAIVGFSGAGKTTIANLLARFWDINQGQILLDGKDIRRYSLASLRTRIQAAAQEVFLFSGSLEDNIRLGKDLSPEAVEQAAAAAQADKFIRELPGGLQFPVSEGGGNLSAGQRQLISFARIIAHDPRIIILDEATANVDTYTEKLIQAALEEVFKNRTSLIIAHRLSTIRSAHRILVFNEGRLVEEGNHRELLDRGGVYYNLCKLQYDLEEEGAVGLFL
jgi:ATP-binding cassette subfamily B protein